MATTKENIPVKGRLVSDPARSEHENGPKLRFRFVEEDFKRENGQLVRDENGYPVVSHRAFHDAVVWYGPLADRIEGTLRSGDAFVATGDLRFSTFEDRDGNSRSSHEFAIQAIGAARRAPSWTRGLACSQAASRRKRPRGGAELVPAAVVRVVMLRMHDAPRSGLRGASGMSPSADQPRIVVHALTQSSCVTHVVSASSSAQSSCGVLQYQTFSQYDGSLACC